VRWILLFLGSVATGVLTTVSSLTLLFISIYLYGRCILKMRGGVAWDPISLFGRVGVVAIPLLIFGLGCGVGFWFLSKRLHA
jgi:hypothetical protein